jgi:hypothetical protein
MSKNKFDEGKWRETLRTRKGFAMQSDALEAAELRALESGIPHYVEYDSTQLPGRKWKAVRTE